MDAFEPPRARRRVAEPDDLACARQAASAALLGAVAVAAAGAQALSTPGSPGPAWVGPALVVVGAVQVIAAGRLARGGLGGAVVACVAVIASTTSMLLWNAWSLRAGWLSPLALLASAVDAPAGVLVVAVAPRIARRLGR